MCDDYDSSLRGIVNDIAEAQRQKAVDDALRQTVWSRPFRGRRTKDVTYHALVDMATSTYRCGRPTQGEQCVHTEGKLPDPRLICRSCRQSVVSRIDRALFEPELEVQVLRCMQGCASDHVAVGFGDHMQASIGACGGPYNTVSRHRLKLKDVLDVLAKGLEAERAEED